jgi:uncharacterized protein YeaO (DUF488 family)
MESISIKRVYDCKTADGSYRVLVDRLWPRGIKKEALHIDEWNKEIAPSTELRKKFNHKAELFDEFSKLYREELLSKEKELNRLRAIAKTEAISLLYGAKDPKINHAIILRNVLLKES